MAHTLKSLPVDAAKLLHFNRSKVTALMTIHLLQELGDDIKIRTRWFWINAPHSFDLRFFCTIYPERPDEG